MAPLKIEMSILTPRTIATTETGNSAPALALLHQAGLLPTPPPDAVVLDSACTMGNVTARFFERAGKDTGTRIVLGEVVDSLLRYTEERIKQEGWPNTEVQRADAHMLPFGDAYFTHSLMVFGPQLMADPEKTFQESHRVLKPSGIIGFTSWLSPGWVASMQACFPSFTPPAFRQGPWCDSSKITSTLQAIGFTEVKIEEIKFDTVEKDVEAYVDLMGVLLPTFFGETEGGLKTYRAFMMEEGMKRGEMKDWQAMIVTAVKP